MTDKELMHQALEALILAQKDAQIGEADYAITALRERLAQPEETVMAEYKHQTYAAYKTDGEMKIGVVPEQEPVAWLYRDSWGTMKLSQVMPPPVGAFPAYTTPPRREWVGLTNDDLKPVCDEYRILFGGWVHDFARAIEAKLKERNT